MAKRVFVCGLSFSGSSALVDLLEDQLEDAMIVPGENDLFWDVFDLIHEGNRSVDDIEKLHYGLEKLKKKLHFTRVIIGQIMCRQLSIRHTLIKKHLRVHRTTLSTKYPLAFSKLVIQTINKFAKEINSNNKEINSRQKFTDFLNSLLSIREKYSFLTYPENQIYIHDQPLQVDRHAEIFDICTNKVKLIVVERDVRDQYVEMYKKYGEKKLNQRAQNKCKKLSINTGTSTLSVDEIVGLWLGYSYKNWHEKYSKIDSKDILFVKFEDLVLKPKKTSKKIFRFLNVSAHYEPKKENKFNPKESCRNIGVYNLMYERSNIVLEYFNKYYTSN